jgi:phosphatidylglycerophosphate synthase
MPALSPALARDPVSAGYRPEWRRPIAAIFRKTAESAVRVCLRWHIHADVISYCSIVASGLAALCFWRAADAPILLVIAPALCYLRLWLNMLDGMVALASNQASPRGEILNDLPDRISDVIIFAGIAHSGLASAIVAYWTAIFALLTAYVGTLGQAVGVQREFSGLMAKPWRMVALHVGAWTAFAMGSAAGAIPVSSLTIIDWTCLVIVAGCLQTIVIRLKRILGALDRKAELDRTTEGAR